MLIAAQTLNTPCDGGLVDPFPVNNVNEKMKYKMNRKFFFKCPHY